MTSGCRRVLMTADTVGGVWTYALQLVSLLEPLGVEVVLATMGRRRTPDQVVASARLPNLEVRESEFRLEWMADPWEDVARAGEWLLALERETRPDLVHLNGYAHAALPWRAPVLVVAHSCVLSWWEAVRGTPVPAEWDTYRRAVARGLAAADLVIAPTRAMRGALARHYRTGGDAWVVPNARDAAAVAGRDAKDPIVFAAGRLWDEAKNLAALDAAAPSLPWPAYVAGDTTGPDGAAVQPAHVRALGALPGGGVREWMARAAIYALPARYEPFGLSVLEAALAGCALVLGDIESLRENWDGAAVFVGPDDVGGLVEAVRRLARDGEERAALGTRARQRATRFSPRRQQRGYAEAYRQVMAGGRPDTLRPRAAPTPQPRPPATGSPP